VPPRSFLTRARADLECSPREISRSTKFAPQHYLASHPSSSRRMKIGERSPIGQTTTLSSSNAYRHRYTVVTLIVKDNCLLQLPIPCINFVPRRCQITWLQLAILKPPPEFLQTCLLASLNFLPTSSYYSERSAVDGSKQPYPDKCCCPTPLILPTCPVRKVES
jgi:hypothetical protein